MTHIDISGIAFAQEPPAHIPREEAPPSAPINGISGDAGITLAQLEGETDSPTNRSRATIDPRYHSMMEIGLSVGVLAFGLLLTMVHVSFFRNQPDWPPIWSFKVLGLTTVISAGLFLIVAGFGQEQTASMMGLLGTAAGYILGKEGKEMGANDSRNVG